MAMHDCNTPAETLASLMVVVAGLSELAPIPAIRLAGTTMGTLIPHLVGQVTSAANAKALLAEAIELANPELEPLGLRIAPMPDTDAANSVLDDLIARLRKGGL